MLAKARRDRLIKAMNDEGVDAILVYGTSWQEAHLRYVSDFGILEGRGAIVVTSDGNSRLYLDSPVEAERASGETSGLEIKQVRDVARAIGDQFDKMANHKLVAAPRNLLPAWLMAKDRRFRIEDGALLIDRLMMDKLPEEHAAFRKAAALADEGYKVFRQASRPGRRQYEIVAEVEAFLRSRGSPDNFMIMGSGGVDVRGMAPPSDRVLAAGDLVTTELTPSIEGYFAQICRTLVIGKATETQKKAFNVYREAMEAGIKAIKPGVTAADVARAENDIFRKYGLGDYVTSKYTRVRGHGLGLSVDTKPNLLEDVDTVLKKGMTLIVHPNTYHPEVGYVVLGDCLIVTDSGAEVLCGTSRELFEQPV
jgi:Xaa-Pro aminopeptidase